MSHHNINDHGGKSSPVSPSRQLQLSLQDDQSGCSEAEDMHFTSAAKTRSSQRQQLKERVANAKKFCDNFAETHPVSTDVIYDVVGELLYDKDTPTQIEILTQLQRAEAALGLFDVSSQSNRLCKDPVGSLLEECLLSHDLTNKPEWLKDICKKFADLTFLMFNIRHTELLEAIKRLLYVESWEVDDVYHFIKAAVVHFFHKTNEIFSIVRLMCARVLLPTTVVPRSEQGADITVRSMFKTCSERELTWLSAMHAVNEEKSLDRLLADMKLSGGLEELSLKAIRQAVQAAINLKKNYKSIEQLKSLLQSHESNVNNNSHNVSVYLALTSKIAEETMQRPLKMTIYLTACALLMKSPDRGRLLQVKSGEGKSLALALTAATLAMMGNKVDVVTSSPVLAQRDCEDWRPFYEKLGLTVACNEDSNMGGSFLCYDKDVVYGTAGCFARDFLRREFLLEDVRIDRSFDYVLVDEVDSMLIDHAIHCTYISHDEANTGMRHLEPILALIWMHASQFRTISLSDKDATVVYHGPLEAFFKTVYDSLPKTDKVKSLEDMFQVGASDKVLPENFTADYFKSDNLTLCKNLLKNLTRHNVIAYLNSVKCEIGNIQFQTFFFSSNGKFLIADENNVSTSRKRKRSGNLSQSGKMVRLLVCDEGLVAALHLEADLLQMLEVTIRDQLSQLEIPTFLQDYVHDRIPLWLANALKAQKLVAGREYEVRENRFISPVDFTASGVIEVNKKWGDGLHQFLEMKHYLPITPMPCITNFLSNVALFRKYSNGGNIVGVSGTLGCEADKNFMAAKYGVDFLEMPSSQNKLFYELDGELVDNESKWREEVCQRVKQIIYQNSFRESGRAVLILCEDIVTAKNLKDFLQDKEVQLVSLYVQNDQRTNYINIKRRLEPGNVVITTNLGARGTDYKCSDSLARNGGLLVLLTFLPYNDRVEDQAFGRTARQGLWGSAQLIINRESLPADLRHFRTLRDVRQELHNRSLAIQEKYTRDVDILLVKDQLFAAYCNMLKIFHTFLDTSGMGNMMMNVQINAVNEVWAQWIEARATTASADDYNNLLTDLKHTMTCSFEKAAKFESPNGNPYHVLGYAAVHMVSGNYAEAVTLLDGVMEHSEPLSAFAHYNKAYCLVFLHVRNSEDNKPDSVLLSIREHLAKAVRKLASYKHELLLTQLFVFAAKSEKQFQGEFAKAMQSRCQIIDYIERNAQAVIELVTQAIISKNSSALALTVEVGDTVSSISSLMVFDDNIEQALSELRQLGMTHIFNVKVDSKVYGGNSEVYFANLCSACIEQAFRTYQLGRMQAIDQTHVIVSTLVNNATNVVKSPSGSPVYDDKNQWNFAMAAAKVAMLRLHYKPESNVQANVREENVIAEMMALARSKLVYAYQPFFDEECRELVFRVVVPFLKCCIEEGLSTIWIGRSGFTDAMMNLFEQHKMQYWSELSMIMNEIRAIKSADLQQQLMYMFQDKKTLIASILKEENADFFSVIFRQKTYSFLGYSEFYFRIASIVHELQGQYRDGPADSGMRGALVNDLLQNLKERVKENVLAIVNEFINELTNTIGSIYDKNVSIDLYRPYTLQQHIQITQTDGFLSSTILQHIQFNLHKTVDLMNSATIFAFEFLEDDKVATSLNGVRLNAQQREELDASQELKCFTDALKHGVRDSSMLSQNAYTWKLLKATRKAQEITVYMTPNMQPNYLLTVIHHNETFSYKTNFYSQTVEHLRSSQRADQKKEFSSRGGRLDCVCGKCKDYLEVPPGAVPVGTYEITQLSPVICNQTAVMDDDYEVSLIKEYVELENRAFVRHVKIVIHHVDAALNYLENIRVRYSLSNGSLKFIENARDLSDEELPDVYYLYDNAAVTIYTKHFTQFVIMMPKNIQPCVPFISDENKRVTLAADFYCKVTRVNEQPAKLVLYVVIRDDHDQVKGEQFRSAIDARELKAGRRRLNGLSHDLSNIPPVVNLDAEIKCSIIFNEIGWQPKRDLCQDLDERDINCTSANSAVYRKTKPADDKKAKIKQLLQSIATKHRSLGPFVLYLSSRDNVEFNDCSLDAWCTFDCTIPGIDLFAVNLDQYDLPGANTDPIDLIEIIKDVVQNILLDTNSERQTDIAALRTAIQDLSNKLNLQDNKIREHDAFIEILAQSSVSTEKIVQMETVVNELVFFHRKPQPDESNDMRQLYYTTLPFVVRIVCRSGEHTSTATGFIINSNGDIVTCRHVIFGKCGPQDKANNRLYRVIEVNTQGNQAVEATVVRHNFDGPMDLAVLSVKDASALCARGHMKFGKSTNVTIWDRVFTTGCPRQEHFVPSEGRVTGLKPSTNKLPDRILCNNISTGKGSSGGPLFNKNGAVIGVVVCMIDKNGLPEPGFTYAIKSDNVTDALKKREIEFDMHQTPDMQDLKQDIARLPS